MKFKQWLEAYHASHTATEKDLLQGIRVTSPHKRPSHNVDDSLAYIEFNELEQEANDLNKQGITPETTAKMRGIIRRQKELLKNYPGLTKVDPAYREVDTAGIYTDKTLEASKKRWWDDMTKPPRTRVKISAEPNNILNVKTSAGWKELLLAKKIASVNKSIPYPEALRQELLKKGYDAIYGGGLPGEEEELVYLTPQKSETI